MNLPKFANKLRFENPLFGKRLWFIFQCPSQKCSLFLTIRAIADIINLVLIIILGWYWQWISKVGTISYSFLLNYLSLDKNDICCLPCLNNAYVQSISEWHVVLASTAAQVNQSWVWMVSADGAVKNSNSNMIIFIIYIHVKIMCPNCLDSKLLCIGSLWVIFCAHENIHQ